jgi:hypothetical protein
MNINPVFTDSRGQEFKPPEEARRELRVWQKFVLSTLIIVTPFAVMGAVTQIDLTANVKGILPTGNGGTGTASTLTGIVRGGSAYTASEFSGDCTTSGSNVVTCQKDNGTTVPVNSAADQTLVTTASATGAWTSIPNCTGALQYATSTHTFSCGAVLTGTFADAEVPTGLINGANTTYTLAHTPSPALSLACYENGVEQRAAGADYTLATATITYGVAPPTGTTLVCSYRW